VIALSSSGLQHAFNSGYTDDIITTKGVLEDGLAFISKPINPMDLLKRIRELLGS